MQKLNKIFTVLTILIMPKVVKPCVLRLLGHYVKNSAIIGFSLIRSDKLILDDNTRIGNFNYIDCRRLVMRNQSYIGNFNRIKGPLTVWLKQQAAIGNRNSIYRAPKTVSFGLAHLKLGILTKITSSHTLDCIQSISFGNYSILAGCRSQLWTHGYYHYPIGPDRFRVDGKINIGNNVYIGSGAIISMGVNIGDAVIIGSNSSVAKNITKAGLYVSQPLRYVETNINETMKKLNRIDSSELIEKVYLKKD